VVACAAMSRHREAAATRLGTLLAGGDHARVRAEARRLLADPAASEADRQSAAAALASLRPELGAVAVTILGVTLALVVAGWLLAGGR